MQKYSKRKHSKKSTSTLLCIRNYRKLNLTEDQRKQNSKRDKYIEIIVLRQFPMTADQSIDQNICMF